MSASNNTCKNLVPLIVFSMVLCAPYLQAQPQQDTKDEAAQSEAPSAQRRIERLGDVTTDGWEMDLALPTAAPALNQGAGELSLPDVDQDQKLQRLLSSLAENPGNENVLTQLNVLLADVLGQANSMMDAGSYLQAGRLLQLLQSVDPALNGLDAAKARLQTSSDMSELLKAGDAALESRRILAPESDNALYHFGQVLGKEPNNQAAQLGMVAVQDALLELALESARELDFEMAEEWLVAASTIREEQKLVDQVREEVAVFKQTHAAELEQKAITAINSGNLNLADISIIDLIALGGEEPRVDALRTRLEDVRLYGGYEAGQVISDGLLKSGGRAPKLVIIPAGSFLMGSAKHSENEKPRHRVIIGKGFALGLREVTVEEFRLFIGHNAYRTTAEVNGSSIVYNESAGRLSKRAGINWKHDYRGKKANPDLPVLHVSMHDASAYVQWLARETGKAYRLPSESEYEYVARAGGSGTYWWGEGSPGDAVENLTGEKDISPSQREWTTSFKKYGDGNWGPAAAGSLGGNDLTHPMGVLDIAGNVSEWTEDCWHQNYIKAPVDGSAWVNPGCTRRVVRGGYWASAPEKSRAAVRIPVNADKYGPVIGFRIARDL